MSCYIISLPLIEMDISLSAHKCLCFNFILISNSHFPLYTFKESYISISTMFEDKLNGFKELNNAGQSNQWGFYIAVISIIVIFLSKISVSLSFVIIKEKIFTCLFSIVLLSLSINKLWKNLSVIARQQKQLDLQ